jgi:hypothetical protein
LEAGLSSIDAGSAHIVKMTSPCAYQWPADQGGPLKYWLSTLPADTPLNDLVAAAH